MSPNPVLVTITEHRFSGLFSGTLKGESSMWSKYPFSDRDIFTFVEEFNSIHKESKSVDETVFVTMMDSSRFSLYQSWSKLTCPLSEGVLSGLYHFPIMSGHVLLTLEAPFQALIQFGNVVGAAGQVRAIVNPSVISQTEVEFLKRWYPNIWFANTSGKPYDPIQDREETLHRKCLILHGSNESQSPLSKFGKNKAILSTIFSYMGTFPSTPVTTIVNRFPLTNPLTSSSLSREYPDYFNTNVRPLISAIASQQSSFWMMGCYELDESYTATDQCCETLLRLQSDSCGPGSIVKPKEQLMIGPKMVLISRFKKSWSTTTTQLTIQTCMDDSETIRSTIASICGNQLDNASSIVSFQNPLECAPGSGGPSEAEIRDAAMNLVWSYSNKTIGGPFAETLRSLAEDLLLNSPIDPTTNTAPLLSTLLQTPPGVSDWSTTQPSPAPQLPRFLLEDVLG